jgi:very-short-patch-repair endonuclease
VIKSSFEKRIFNIRYAMNPQAFMQNTEAEKKTDSEFEERVMKRLLQAGYHVIPQWSVGAYRIDLVIEGAGKRLAVECDGDRWHTLENLDDDMARQAILERLGWRFVRIRGSQFFRDFDKAMEPVFARLRELEIPAEGAQDSVPSNPTGQVLQETIIRRAAELRREWGQPLAQTSSSVTSPAVPLRRSPAENSSKPFSLLQFLAEKRLQIVDKRSSGGCLWVIGGHELAPIMEDLKAKGVKFTFAAKGFSYRQNQSQVHTNGWYIK